MRKSIPGKQAGKTSRNKKQEFPGVSHYRDRHGKLRWRYRDKGFTVNLGREYGSPEFIRRYTAAVNGERLPAGGSPRRTSQALLGASSCKEGQHSLSSLIASWYKSSQFTQLAKSTRRDYQLVAERLREEHGHRPVETMSRAIIKKLMAKKADTPEAANKLLRIFRLLLDHAMDIEEWIDTNPAREVSKMASKNRDGFHTWNDDEIETYFKHHPRGSMADLAMSTMLYTGAARADAVKLGKSNLSADNKRLRYERQKMKTRGGATVDIPIHPELALRLDRLAPDQETFLQTNAGKERSAAGLGNLMRKWCDDAGLPDCTAHGLRKACARRLAEAGATPHEIMAVTGHKTLAEVERYTRKVARASLADSAMGKTL